MKGEIYFLTGAPGVGKTTTAEVLASHFDRSLMLDVDEFRKFVVKGRSEPSEGWSEETTLQFHLAHVAVGKVAHLYAEAGFAVVIAHCSSVESVQTFLEYAGPSHVICLRAEMESNLTRNRERQNKSFDPLDIEHFVLSLGETMPRQYSDAGFVVLDNTKLTISETVQQILLSKTSI